jgi:hypothetical protein
MPSNTQSITIESVAGRAERNGAPVFNDRARAVDFACDTYNGTTLVMPTTPEAEAFAISGFYNKAERWLGVWLFEPHQAEATLRQLALLGFKLRLNGETL